MIERTFDVDYIRSAVTHPAVWKWASDDSCDVDTYQPPMGDHVYWLKMTHDGQNCGVYMVHAHNSTTCEIHTCLFPESRGRIAKIAAREVLEWVFSNTGFTKVVTSVPVNNIHAYAYAKRAGLIDEGLNRKSIKVNGEIIDQFTLGITSEEFEWQQQQSP